ncbi:hypothetical protein F4825DRAFT_437731 [Nemania diffusa]|nr:hypothetical protein F4825DRAFT_437731 [Nemania diffusa]
MTNFLRFTLLVQAASVLAVPQAGQAKLTRRQSVDCTYSVAAGTGATCDSVAGSWGISEADFIALNPGVTCPNLVVGQLYCVLGSVSTATTTSTTSSTTKATTSTTKATTSTTKTTTTTTKATTTTTTTTASTTKAPTSTTKTTTTTTTTADPHSPSQSGLAKNCNKFYKVVGGDTCNKITSQYSISLDQFRTWNPSIDSACDNLLVDYWVCVGVPGAVTVPSPLMPGTISNCKTFYLVKSGDTCGTIDAQYGLSLATFRTWNTMINADCTNLFLGYYVCVGV